MPDFSAIGYLALIGLGVIVIAAITLPIGGLWVLAWLLEPRVGASIWLYWQGLGVLYFLASSAFFGAMFSGLWR